jgi:phage terminase large subunit-like protein
MLKSMSPEKRKALLTKITPTVDDIRGLEKTDAEELYQQAEAQANFSKHNKLLTLYPEYGPLRRGLYKKHMQFFRAGKEYNERAVIAANRSGKSFGIGGYETTLHLTGLYPEWWEGRRFHGPTEAWAAGDTSETTRDIIQHIMLGNPGEFGTGLIPKDCILGNPTHRAGVAAAVDTVRVRHTSGGTSWLGFKSYDQGRAKFQGTAKDIVWLDEEPPLDVYTECLTRLMTRNGIILCTFTPLSGLSDVVLMYMPSMAPEPDTIEMEAF